MSSQAEIDQTRDVHERILAALRGLRYGSVTAVVQDGVVVQVDRTEKVRVERPEAASPSAPRAAR